MSEACPRKQFPEVKKLCVHSVHLSPFSYDGSPSTGFEASIRIGVSVGAGWAAPVMQYGSAVFPQRRLLHSWPSFLVVPVSIGLFPLYLPRILVAIVKVGLGGGVYHMGMRFVIHWISTERKVLVTLLALSGQCKKRLGLLSNPSKDFSNLPRQIQTPTGCIFWCRPPWN